MGFHARRETELEARPGPRHRAADADDRACPPFVPHTRIGRALDAAARSARARRRTDNSRRRPGSPGLEKASAGRAPTERQARVVSGTKLIGRLAGFRFGFPT